MSTAWAGLEVQFDWWQLVPRLALWFVLGLVLLIPVFRRPLDSRSGGLPLVGSLVIAAVVALVAQFVNYNRLDGDLGRDTAGTQSAAPTAADGDWPSYGRTAFGDRYSPLKQIDVNNVKELQPAWTFRTGDIPGPNDPQETTAENTPLKVNGKLYVCTPHSQVIAVDPDSGN